MVTPWIALGLVAAILLVTAAIGIWHARGRVASVEDFIVARNTTGTGLTTATLVASSMGAWILFSPAEAGASFGGASAVAGYAVGSSLAMLAYVVIGPRIRTLVPHGHTLTEYAYVRYGRTMYAYVVFVSVFYMFIFLAANMTGIVGALSLVAGVPAWQTAGVIGLTAVAYTAYGGLRATIVTDAVQFLVILPLLAVLFLAALVSLGGPSEIGSTVVSTDPHLLEPGFLPGVQFGVFVVVAIVAAELLNQAWWQRIYASRDLRTVRRSFAYAAVAVIPIVLLAGSFGVVAAGYGLVEEPGDASVALFLVVTTALPNWVGLVVVVLAALLVASTADTIFSAIASIVTADLPRLTELDGETLTTVARLTTVAVALGATVIGAQAYSVLELFLTADLFAAATFVPLLYGLYSTRVTERAVIGASVAGLLVGLAFFPTTHGLLSVIPVLGGLLPTPSFLVAFVGAAAVSGGLTAASARVTDDGFDVGRLASEITRLDGSGGSAAPNDD